MSKNKIIVAVLCLVLSFASYNFFSDKADSARVNAAISTKAANGISDLSDLSYELGLQSRGSYKRDQRKASEAYANAESHRNKETIYNVCSYLIPALLIGLGFFYLMPSKKKKNE